MKRPDPQRISGTSTISRRTNPLGALAAIATIAIVVAAAVFPGVSLANCPVRSGNPERTPDANLTYNGNGTVTHTTTGLMWKQCPEGRTASGSSCTGTTGSYSWQTALRRAVSDTTAGYTDWRLPSRTELLSIVETGCTSPAINTTRFPNVAASAAFWTSTHAGALAPDSAFAVRFNHGISLLATKDFLANARLVRGGDTAHDSYRAAAPAEPAAFSFPAKVANPGETVSSATVTMSGLTATRNISIVGGEYKIGAGAWTTANGTIANGNTLQLRVTAPNTVPSSTSATVNVNGRTASFLITTGNAPPDTIPDSFVFTNQTGVTPSTVITSAPITVSGINQATNISITGGEYQINGGGWTNAAGSVFNNDSVAVRHTSGATSNATVDTVLTIGTSSTVSATFSSTTFTIDTTPNAITFATQTGVPRSTETISATHTITGINMPATVTALTAGHAYDKNDGNWITTTGDTIANNDVIRVKHTSAAGFSTNTDTSITIGGVTGTFRSTTEAIDTTPDAFSFVDQTNVALNTDIISASITIAGINSPATVSALTAGGAYDVNGSGTWITATGGTVSNGDTIRLKRNSGGSFSAATNTTITIGGTSDTFTITTVAADSTPDAFTFTDQTGVATGTTVTSTPIVVSGINTTATLSTTGSTATNNQYQIYNANDTVRVAWTNPASHTVVNGEKVAVRHTSSGSNSTMVFTRLTIGGVSDDFNSTTVAPAGDSSPDQFTFTDQTAVALSSLRTSNTITVTGIDVATPISISGGEYQIGAGAWTSAPGSVTVNQTVTVRHTASASFSTATDTTLTIGDKSDIFTSTTLAADTTPTAFVFTDQTAVALSTTVTSNAISVAGINTGAAISVTGGTYSINGGAYTSTAGTVNNGDSVTVQHTSSATELTATDTTLTIGGVSDIFTSTTGDKTPTAFAFTDQGPVALTTLVTSNTLTLAGITIPANISISGGEYQINGGAWTSTAGTISNGQTFAVRHTSSATEATTTNTVLTIGGTASDTFTSTTGVKTPTQFTITDLTGVALNTLTESAPFTVAGITIAANISVSGAAGSQYKIGAGGTWTSTSGTVTNGQAVYVRHTSSTSNSTVVSTTLTIGDTVSETFTTTTVAACGTTTWAAASFANTSNDKTASCTTTSKPLTGLCAGTNYTFSRTYQNLGGGGSTAAMSYSIDGTNFITTASGTVGPTNTVTFKFTQQNKDKGNYIYSMTIGGVTKTWTHNTDGAGTCTPP